MLRRSVCCQGSNGNSRESISIPRFSGNRANLAPGKRNALRQFIQGQSSSKSVRVELS